MTELHVFFDAMQIPMPLPLSTRTYAGRKAFWAEILEMDKYNAEHSFSRSRREVNTFPKSALCNNSLNNIRHQFALTTLLWERKIDKNLFRNSLLNTSFEIFWNDS